MPPALGVLGAICVPPKCKGDQPCLPCPSELRTSAGQAPGWAAAHGQKGTGRAGRVMGCWESPALPHHTPPGALHWPDLHLQVLRKCICLQFWEQSPLLGQLPAQGLGSAQPGTAHRQEWLTQVSSGVSALGESWEVKDSELNEIIELDKDGMFLWAGISVSC